MGQRDLIAIARVYQLCKLLLPFIEYLFKLRRRHESRVFPDLHRHNLT
jgi:hypothetical protein